MADRDRSLFDDLKDQWALLQADVREMLALRWQLVRLELLRAADHARRLAIAAVVATVMVLTAVSLLAVSLADLLDNVGGIPRAGWLAIFAGVLLVAAVVIAVLTWRWFRRSATGLTESIDELREDVYWLREWIGRSRK